MARLLTTIEKRKPFDVIVVTFSKALNAEPSDGRPRGRLLDFASAVDESTKRCDACDASDAGNCDGGETLLGFEAAWLGGLCIGEAGTGRRIWKNDTND